MDIAMLCCRHRSRYISLIVKKNLQNPSTGKRSELTIQDEDDLDEVERLLPMCTLILFRQLGVKEALVQSKQHADQLELSSDRKKKKLFSVNMISMMTLDVKAPVNWLRRMSLSRGDVDAKEHRGRVGEDGRSLAEDKAEGTVDRVAAEGGGGETEEEGGATGVLAAAAEVVDEVTKQCILLI
jgi:hypothetical protein